MSRYLLSELESANVYSSQDTFATGDTVTIVIYNNGTLETLTSNACTEIGTTGNFLFSLSNITTQPETYSELYWIMSSTAQDESGLLVAGGWTELLNSLPQALDAADECRVTVNLYKIGGGINPINPETLFDITKTNHIELLAKYYDGSRYFKLEEIKPSYSDDTATASWVLPQGASVNIQLDSFGITKTTVTIPSQSTIDLFDLLAL